MPFIHDETLIQDAVTAKARGKATFSRMRSISEKQVDAHHVESRSWSVGATASSRRWGVGGSPSEVVEARRRLSLR